jgi:drug/metabolite transporter superfamily protein YnfA
VNPTVAELRDGFVAEGPPYDRTHTVMACVGVGHGRGLRFVATFQSDPNFGRIRAAYGGVLVAGSLLWGGVIGGFRPDRFDILGAALGRQRRTTGAMSQPVDELVDAKARESLAGRGHEHGRAWVRRSAAGFEEFG